TDTQKEFVSTCNTDKLLKSIEIANEINPEYYTFGYIKEIYSNDKNFIEKKKAPVIASNKDFNKSNIQNSNNIIDNFEPKYNHSSNNNFKSSNKNNLSYNPNKTRYHNIGHSFSKYTPDELETILLESQKNKFSSR
ncbi:hypothetical protein EAI30_16295, partial [Romboutsia ilealis]|nr:hypothetical protein [Romboutsia ilealis]